MLEQYFRYTPPIPKDLQDAYETELMRVYHWRGGNWREDISETDMDHVRGMFWVLEDVKKSCPTLSSEVNIKTVQDMIYIHDAGEIIKGDLTHNRGDYDFAYDDWKRKERIGGKWLIRKIEDRNIRMQAMKLYERCMSPQPEDKEALLTDFIDKDQGCRFGFKYVFNGKGMKQKAKQMQMNHVIELLRKPTSALLKLVSPSAQDELANFLRDELTRFSKCGYRKEASPYINNLSLISQ